MNDVAVPIDRIRFVKELYPRLREDEAAIERYRVALDQLPPIVVARGAVLVDGFHRWKAHEREKIEQIAVEDLGDLTDAEIVRESISRNATHGQQLSQADKKRLAGELWLKHFAAMPNGERAAEIMALLSVSRDTVERWTKDARAAEKKAQQDRAWDLWLDCLSQRDIANQIGPALGTINEWIVQKSASADFRTARDSVVERGRPKKDLRTQIFLPPSDPGHFIAHRWRPRAEARASPAA